MGHTSRFALAGLLLATLAIPAPAAAQTEQPIRLEVRGGPDLDVDALRQRLEEDLGAEVRLVSPEEVAEPAPVVTPPQPAGAGEAPVDAPPELSVAVGDDGAIRIVYRRPGVPARVRDTVAVEDRQETTVIIALIASNLVRDEASELLESLRRPEPEAEAATTQPLPEPQPEPEPEPPVVVYMDPPAEAEEPEEAPEPEPEEELPEASGPNPTPLRMPIAIDFAPGVGFSSFTRGRDVRTASFGMLGAWAGRLRGVGGSGIVDISSHGVEGAQMAGVVAFNGGRLTGIQGSGVVSITGGAVEGVQLSGIANVASGDMTGAQLSGILNVASGDLRGVQGGLVNVLGGGGEGYQGGLVNVAGAQLHGAQAGLVNLAGGGIDGFQGGLVNIAGGESSGLQLGLVNVGGSPLHGVQVGLFNIAPSADAAVGLVNIHPDGRTQVRGQIDSNGFARVSLVHGARITHNLYEVAYNPFVGANGSLSFGLGYGLRASFAEDDALHLDFDVLAHALVPTTFDAEPDTLAEPRVTLGVQLAPGIGLTISAAYVFQVTWRSNMDEEAPLDGPLATSVGSRVTGAPTLMLGLSTF